MKKYHKISQRIILILAAIWFLLLPFKGIELGYRYIYVGLLIFYVGVQNIILLNLGQRSGEMPDKLLMYQERLGAQKGLIRYAVVAAAFILIGLVIAYSGYSVLPRA